MDSYGTREIIRIAENSMLRIDEPIVEEVLFTLELNGRKVMHFFCTPRDLEALAAGWLRTNGKIGCPKDIESLVVDMENGKISAVVGGSSSVSAGNYPERPFVTGSQIHSIFHTFNMSCELFYKTGGAHSCAILPIERIERFDGKFPVFMEDVARRNSVYKAVGSALASGLAPESAMLLFSGRLALEIVDTAAGFGFPIILAAGAPSIAAIETAEKQGVTLAGFIKPDKINIYTHPHRIKCEVPYTAF